MIYVMPLAEPIANTWGHRLKVLRVNAGLTQAELGAAVGIKQGTVARYESGDRTPPDEMRAKLADALGADPADVFQW